jgi:hypothetical protein
MKELYRRFGRRLYEGAVAVLVAFALVHVVLHPNLLDITFLVLMAGLYMFRLSIWAVTRR